MLIDTLVADIEAEALGYSFRAERAATLEVSIAASGATEVVVDDQDLLGPGIVQIDSELLQVSSVTSGEGRVPAWGRGVATSTAASHSAGAKVTFAPMFPRVKVVKALIDTVNDLWPDLFGLAKYEFESESNRRTYSLPAYATDVLDVKVEVKGNPTGYWERLASYSFDATANLTEYPTGNTLHLPELPSGYTVDVTMEVRPELHSTIESWAEMGLYESARGVVINGALYRLLQSVDVAHTDTQTASAAQRQRENAVSASEQAGRHLALYYELLQRERSRMLASINERIVKQ